MLPRDLVILEILDADSGPGKGFGERINNVGIIDCGATWHRVLFNMSCNLASLQTAGVARAQHSIPFLMSALLILVAESEVV